MDVVHVSTFLHGGAATAARRLHDSLRQRGVASTFCSLTGQPPDESYVTIEKAGQADLFRRWARKVAKGLKRASLDYHLQGRPDGFDCFSAPNLFGVRTPRSMISRAPCLLNLHWIADFIDYPSFFLSIPDASPIVWTLHDMNPFTGGCHYSCDCLRYRSQCHHCPQLGIRGAHDFSAKGFHVKRTLLKNKNLHIVADSHWLEREARSSAILSNARSFQTIHYGLDTETFSPRDKRCCRQALGIDPEGIVISFGAHSVDNRRKGIRELLGALSRVVTNRVLLLLVFGGRGSWETPRGFPTLSVGFIESPTLLASVYSASDVFVIPSLYEAFGQTALEAMACGTPVVGFDTGGIPDIVRHGHTGLLAKAGDESDLAAQIQRMIDNPNERLEIGRKARLLAETEYSLAVQAEQYISLYGRICEGLSVGCSTIGCSSNVGPR